MKKIKRLLTAILTLALALGLAMPAMAAVDWDDFRITKHPQSMIIKHGESFTLSVEVNVPDGVEVEYQWYLWSKGGGSKPITGATAKDFHCSSTYIEYPYVNNYDEYYCEITAYEKDDNGNELSSQSLVSGRARVNAEAENKKPTFWEKLLGFFLQPFISFAFLFLMIVGPVVDAPYLWVKGLFS